MDRCEYKQLTEVNYCIPSKCHGFVFFNGQMAETCKSANSTKGWIEIYAIRKLNYITVKEHAKNLLLEKGKWPYWHVYRDASGLLATVKLYGDIVIIACDHSGEPIKLDGNI